MRHYRILAIRKPGIESTLWRLEEQRKFLWWKWWWYIDSAYDYDKKRIVDQFNALSAGLKTRTYVEIDTHFHSKGTTYTQ